MPKSKASTDDPKTTLHPPCTKCGEQMHLTLLSRWRPARSPHV